MIKKTILAATVFLAGAATAASAATFELLDPNSELQSKTLDDKSITDEGFDLEGLDVSFLTGLDLDDNNGLALVSGPGRLKFTYLGSEAGNSNYAAYLGGIIFENGVGGSSYMDTFAANQLVDGLVDFSFGTSEPDNKIGEISNIGEADPMSADYAIGYSKITDTSYYLLFDDISQGDRDFDDIVLRIDVAPVPVPAGILLMGTALAGFGVMSRRKGKKAA